MLSLTDNADNKGWSVVHSKTEAPTPRRWHTINKVSTYFQFLSPVLILDEFVQVKEKLYVFGGYDEKTRPLGDLNVFDIGKFNATICCESKNEC